MESEDAGGDGGGRMSPDDKKDVKRRMKSKEQLEALEKAYNEQKYPLESTRAELSATLKLTDKQLQVWFSHRRLKDRKGEDNPSVAPKKAKKDKEKEKPATEKARVAPADHVQEQGPQQLAQQPSKAKPQQEEEEDCLVMSLQPSQAQPALVVPPPDQPGAEAKHAMEDSEWEAAPPASKARRKNTDSAAAPKRKPPAKGRRTAAELAALKAFEAQMVEPLREDGPPLGFEFDPIPPIGFAGHPIERDLPLDPPEELEDVPKVAVRRGLTARKVKAAARNRPPLPTTTGVKRKAGGKAASTSTALPQATRPLREYQFIPEQPTGRPEEQNFYDKATELNLYPNAERPFDVVSASRVRSLTQPAPIFPSNEAYTAGEGYYQARVASVGASMFPTAEAGAGGLIAPNDLNFEGGQRMEGLPSYDVDPSKALFHLASRHDNHARHESLNLYQEQDRARQEKKRKMEEAKLHKEMEAQEKRMKKEQDKQEIARRKEEEQRKKDAEKQMREKKKEQEKMQKEQERKMREAQREEERIKKLQEKESKRLEKLRQKEELRQQKEAARVKAANERATAKKLAKENAETMDDERLELMELAVSALGLSSITQLPVDTGAEVLDEYKTMLKTFPPPSVKMKQTVLVRPWTDNEENIGNALMVFRFLTSFADVLGLWSFTFDELLQAFHDYDPRLLGDIHVALLRTLVKDVEEASQAAITVPGGSQYASFVISGGHPEIVESAYRWGFDIREWRTHLSPLTWPEILRQFALAAAIGPKWKTRKVEPSQAKVNVKVTEGEDVVSTLRSGAAAANAVALMQGKGVGQVRRNQYRMTPGTVKFAAFHILSLEGDKGLSIPQVADLMQKTGLRDLSLSRTPEASIAAALSRDANLFERVAPSTYCVRPAFRKDPSDREQVLDAAREKIALFKSGQLEGEEADKEVEDPEEAEEALRDEEYGLEEQDIDDKATYAELTPGKAVSPSKSEKAVNLGDDNDTGEKDFQSPEHNATDRSISCALTVGVNNSKHAGDIKDGGTRPESTKPELAYAETEIDESQAGEAWVQGLAEGEYGDLSVEERLNALVALVNVVNEGTTIRLALEDRLESAQALKRQMWVEAQLDRRRSKDEPARSQVPGAAGVKVEGASPSGVLDGRQSSPLLSSDSKQDIAQLGLQSAEAGGANAGEGHVVISAKKPLAGQDLIAGQDVSVQAFAHPTEKSRAQLKADIGVRAEELFVCRSVPLGLDRRRNRYWQFVTSSGGEDPGCSRIYFESVDGRWEVLDTEETLDALMASLDVRGCREFSLHQNLLRLEGSLRSAMRKQQNLQGDVKVETGADCHVESETGSRHEPSGIIACTAVDGSPASGVYGQDNDFLDRKAAVSLDLGKNEHQRRKALERYRDLDEWVWGTSSLRAKSCKKRDQELLSNCSVCHDFYWLRDKHCPHCHGTFDQSSKMYTKFLEHTRECEERMRNGDPSWKPTEPFPCRFQQLKSQLLAIEGAIPTAALKVPWKDQQRKTWVSNLKQASVSGEVLQAVAELEDIVSGDWLLSSYETTEEMLKNVPESVENHNIEESNPRVLPWIPQTTAAVALKVSLFDAAIAYTHEEKLQREKQKEEDAKSVKVGVSAVKISPELVPADRNGAHGAEDAAGDGPADGKGRSRKKRADGQPKSKSKARTSGGGAGGIGGRDGGGSGNGRLVGGAKSSVGTGKNAGGSAKRGLKRKLHFSEDGTGGAADAVDNQLHAKEQKRPRSGTGKAGGRPRGRPPGRPRNKVAGSVSRGGRKSKAGSVAKQKERDPNELMASADDRQQKLSHARAPHHDEDTDEDDEGYQYVDEQGDWGPPDDTDEGEQYEEEQLDDDNGEYIEEDGSGDGMDEDVSGDPGHGHHLTDHDEEDEPVDEDDARCEDDDGYTGLQETDDEEATGYAEDASEDDAGERMPSYSSSDE